MNVNFLTLTSTRLTKIAIKRPKTIKNNFKCNQFALFVVFLQENKTKQIIN